MKNSRKYLVKKLDQVFSIYIRQKYADKNGYVECFTCQRVYHWKKIQCGHFQSRKYYSTRWLEDNCKPQCYSCNVMKYGEQFIFGRRLDQIYGEKTAEKLLFMSKETKKFNNFELQEMIEKYKALNESSATS